jgi:hypothetical protein
METEKSLVKVSEVKLPKFVEDAYNTIDGMQKFAGMLLESKLVPDHFYEKGADNKPDYTKGKVPAVVVVLLQAQQLAIPPMTALQHVIPVNGLLSIKGDLAKTMIFASGKLKKDSWKETVTGSIENEDMVVTITATREDNGLTLTRTFSVDKAKRMGLWITSAQVNGADGWKWKKSAWYKTPDRMLNYRALGNIARDLFSDVLLNMYTTEEAVDIQRETSETLETESGAKIIIPDKEHSRSRSTKMTDRVADKITDNKFGAVNTGITDAVVIEPEKQQIQKEAIQNASTYNDGAPEHLKANESPFKADKGSAEYMNGVLVVRDQESGDILNMDEIEAGKVNNEPAKPGELTLKQMEDMDTKVLLQMVNDDMDMMEACQTIGGKNTNKKLRDIIFAHQNNKLAELVAPYLKAGDQITPAPPSGDIPPNKDFYNQVGSDNSQGAIQDFLDPKKEVKKPVDAGNKYNLVVPEYNKGNQREFGTTKSLFNAMMGITPQITTPRYMELAGKLNLLEKYKDKEIFCRDASVTEINLLLNEN